MPGMVMNRNCVTPYHERPNCVISPFLDVEKYSRLRLHRLPPGEQCGFHLEPNARPRLIDHAAGGAPTLLRHIASLSHNIDYNDGYIHLPHQQQANS